MFWKSAAKKKADVFESALAEMMPAAAQVAEKWKFYNDRMVFQDDVPLHEQVRLFSIPLAEFIAKSYPNISKTEPFVYLATLLIGIYMAKTHPIPEVLGVARYLDGELGTDAVESTLSTFVKGTPNL